MPPRDASSRSILQITLIVLAIVAVALLLWVLRNVVILVFGSIVLAVILRVIANPLKARFGLPERIALLLAILMVTGVIGLAFWLFGQEVARQAEILRETIPSAWQSLIDRLEAYGIAEPLQQWLRSAGGSTGSVVAGLRGVALSVTNAVADAVLLIVGGIYLAADPQLYRRGLVKLVPAHLRPKLDQALEDCWIALRLWLVGRLTTMVIVGVLTGVGLWLFGMPAALTLGIAAGVLDFVPFVGPIVAAVPAILLALATSPALALWVLGIYIVVQQIEGNVVTPLIQQRMVSLPPALLLFALVALGLLFGVIGVILAEPLTVALYILVKRLYIRGYLQTATPIPGEVAEEDG